MFSIFILVLLAAGSCIHSIDLKQSESMVLSTGQLLTLKCEISGYSVIDSKYCTHWIRQPAGKALEWIGWVCGNGFTHYSETLKSRFGISIDNSSNSVTLSGQKMQSEDTAVYYCARGLGHFDYWGKGTQVTVTSVTGTPQLYPLSQCGQCSDNFTIGCMARGLSDPNPNFEWFDSRGNVLTNFVQYPGALSDGSYTAVSHLEIAPNDWNKGNSFKCQVGDSKGKQKTTVAKPGPVTLNISPPRAKELYMEKKAIIECVISGTTEHDVDKAVSWTFGSNTNLSVNNSNVQGGEKQYTKSSVLTISSSNWFSGNEVECNTAGAKPVKTSYKTESEPSVLLYTSDLHKNTITLVCEASSPHPSSVYIGWKVDHTQVIDGNHTAFIRKSDGNTFVYSYLTVTNEKYEKSLFECAVYHDDKEPKLFTGSKSKPRCPPCPVQCDY